MSSEWPKVEIGQLAKLRSGFPFKSADWKESGVPVIKIANVKAGRIVADGCGFVSNDIAAQSVEWYTRPGDVLIAMTGYVGEVAQVKPGELFLINQRVGRFDFKTNSEVDQTYFFYHLQHSETRAEIEGLARGSAQPNLSAADAHKIKITVPPHSIQREIASTLRALDDRINLLRETNTTLEAIGQALFKSWFVDFDPVRAKMEGRQPKGMDEATAALFPDSFEESELGPVPKGWRTDQLERWLSVLETGRRPKGGVGGIESGVPSIGAESIIKIGEFNFEKVKYVSDDFFAEMKSGKLSSRDVLLYKDGGKPGVFLPRVSMFGDGFPFEVCGINEHVFRIRLKKPFGQTYLYYWLWSDSVMHELKHRGGKAAIPGINQADVRELKMIIPEDQILDRLEEITDPIVSIILNNAKQMQSLASLRDTLLPRLISGQLRLPNTEALSA